MTRKRCSIGLRQPPSPTMLEPGADGVIRHSIKMLRIRLCLHIRPGPMESEQVTLWPLLDRTGGIP